MAAVLLTPPFLQFLDENGDSLTNGKVYSYAAGTTTPKATFTDSTGLIEAANPVLLDSAGRAVIWITGAYKFEIRDSNDNLIRTVDNITSFNTLADQAEAFFQSFSGNGSQTVFVVSEDLGTEEKALMVFVDAGGGKGYDILNPVAYTINGTSLTFAVAPASGTNNIYVFAPSLLLGAASAAADAAATSAASAATSAAAAQASADSAVAFSNAKNMWTYSSNIAMANPGTGFLRFNNATPASVTAIAISDLSANSGNPDMSPWVLSWDDVTGAAVRGTLYIYNDQSNFAFYQITGATTDNVGWSQLSVTYLTGAGVLTDMNSLYIGFAAAGSINATGGITALTNDVLASGSGSVAATIASNAVTNAKAAQMPTLTIKSNVTGITANSSDNTLTQVLDATVSNTRGTLLYRGASNWLPLAPGTSGQALLSGGVGADPSWGSAPSGSFVLLSSQTASSSSSLDFTSVITSAYDAYFFLFMDIKPPSGNPAFSLRTSSNNSTFDANNGDYVWANYNGVNLGAGSLLTDSFGGSGASPNLIQIGAVVSSAASSPLNGHMYLYNPLSSARRKTVNGQVSYYNATVNENIQQEFAGSRTTNTAINAVRFLFASGVIQSGIIRCYGIKN